jgi:hypothetical protein
VFDEFRMKCDLTTKWELPDSIEIAILKTIENVEPLINFIF